MLNALELIIEQMTHENITRGVAKSIHEMSYAISQSTWYTPAQVEFAEKVHRASGRAYRTFVPKLKTLLSEYRTSQK